MNVQPAEPPNPLARKPVTRPGVLRFSAVELLAVLALLFLSAAFIEDLPNGDVVETALVTGVMVASVLAVGRRRRSLTIALLLVAPAAAARWANHFWPGIASSLVSLFAHIAFFGFVVAHLVRFILRAPHVDANVLCAGLSGYLLLGLLWVPAYMAVAKVNPGAFRLPSGPGETKTLTSFNAFYFSFMTLSTVGYGDITPVSKGARMLAVMEAITGLFYVAVLISRLVAIYSSPQRPAGTGNDAPSG